MGPPNILRKTTINRTKAIEAKVAVNSFPYINNYLAIYRFTFIFTGWITVFFATP